MPSQLKPNKHKSLCICVDRTVYARYPVRTHVITSSDSLIQVAERYLLSHLQSGDVVFLSERMVAITQGRALPITNIKTSRLATLLSRCVHKTPAGIGIGCPWTMEIALREAGVIRILFAAALSAITKPFGMRGLFYILAGHGVHAIDGPCDYTLPPYHRYVVLGPKNPDNVAKELKRRLKCEVVIIDANDLGVRVLGASNASMDRDRAARIFSDNPLGQSREQTPMCIVRKIQIGRTSKK